MSRRHDQHQNRHSKNRALRLLRRGRRETALNNRYAAESIFAGRGVAEEHLGGEDILDFKCRKPNENSFSVLSEDRRPVKRRRTDSNMVDSKYCGWISGGDSWPSNSNFETGAPQFGGPFAVSQATPLPPSRPQPKHQAQDCRVRSLVAEQPKQVTTNEFLAMGHSNRCWCSEVHGRFVHIVSERSEDDWVIPIPSASSIDSPWSNASVLARLTTPSPEPIRVNYAAWEMIRMNPEQESPTSHQPSLAGTTRSEGKKAIVKLPVAVPKLPNPTPTTFQGQEVPQRSDSVSSTASTASSSWEIVSKEPEVAKGLFGKAKWL